MSAFIKCPNNCGCLFITEHDLNRHKKVCGVANIEWRKSNFDDSEWCFASEDPHLASAIRANGKLTLAGFDLTLDPSGKYLKKRIARQ